MEKLSAADWSVLTLKAVQCSEQQIRLSIVDVPYIAEGFGMDQFLQDCDSMVTIQHLVLAQLIGMGADNEIWITTRSLDMYLQLFPQIIGHYVRIERMSDQVT